MTTDIAVANTLKTISRPCDVPASFTEMQMLARILAGSKMMPPHLRGDEASVLAVMIASRALDIPMWSGFQGLIVIEGKTGMSAHMMQALVLRAGFGLFPVQEECTTERAVVRCVRPGIGPDDTAMVEFTIEDAIRAGLVTRTDDGTLIARSEKNGRTTILPWEKYGNQMLKRRATSVGARDYYQDVLLGMVYLPEEIGGDSDADGNPVFRESQRVVISDEVAAILLRVQNAETAEALREVWKDAKVSGLLDAVNLAGEPVREIIDMRGETLQRREAKQAKPKPAEAPATQTDDATPADAETAADTSEDIPADDAASPDPPETRQKDGERDELENRLADLYPNGWGDVEQACVAAYGLLPEDTATSKLEDLARARQTEMTQGEQ